MNRMSPVFALLVACGGSEPPAETPPAEPSPAPDAAAAPTSGRPEVTAELVADRDAKRHPSDGAGTVTLDNDPGWLVAGGPGRFELTFTVSEHGIADGGAIVFQSPPFWGWSPPQLRAPEAPGFTTVRLPEGLVGTPVVADQGTLVIPVTGRALKPGETVSIVYGDGVGARVDRFSDPAQPFWFGVDGDGDGIRSVVPGPPRVAIHAGPPARLHCVVDTTRQPDEPYTLHLSRLDGLGNLVEDADPVTVALDGPGLPARVVLADTLAVEATAPPGVHRIVATDGTHDCITNPLIVRDGAPRVQWMDLQIHSGESDGTATHAALYRYGREVAGLDGMAITDHDHWGMRFLDDQPALWERMVAMADAMNEDDFVVVPAYEWTNWTHGHRHVLIFGDDRTLRSTLNPAFDTPAKHRAATPASDIVIPHHVGGGPVAVHWPTHPETEGVVELCSVHGSSESADTPGRIYDPVPGAFVRDALDAGYRPGFLCSTDGHDGHPGLSQLSGPYGGLAAILDAGPGREGLRDALVSRRTYGTNGPRILLRAQVGDHPMGSDLGPGDHALEVRVVAEAPLSRIELVRGGRGEGAVAASIGGDALTGAVAFHTFALNGLVAGEYAYVRVVQVDGGAAWSSPFYVRGKGDDASGVAPPTR
jgi:hypothetical protein